MRRSIVVTMDRFHAARLMTAASFMARGASLILIWAGLAACDAEHDPAVRATPSRPAPSDSASLIRPQASAPDLSRSVPQRSIARFVPSEHGFAFVNRFSGSPLPSKTLTRLWGGRMDYGLCGGMSYAAADYFLADQPIPGSIAPPAEGSALYIDLQHRQMQSLGIALTGSLRFAVWMGMSDHAVQMLTIWQLAGIIAALDRGEPVVLGLVYHSFDETLAVWHNHQVLAYRVADRSPAGVTLLVYDPNHPGNDEVVIAVRSVDGSPLAGGSEIRTSKLVPGRRARRIRGIFAMPYRFASPPSHDRTSQAD